MDDGKEQGVCPVCGADIGPDDVYQEEYSDIETAECPKCGFTYSYLAGEG